MTGTVAVPSFRGYTGATLHLAIDATEHQRRQDHGLRAITSMELLDTLMALPHTEPVPFKGLTPRQQSFLHHAPKHVVRITNTGVVWRVALRPCRVVRATVRSATACKTALGKASSFAPFCERAVIVTTRPRMPETLIEFGFWGIGLYLDRGNGQLEPLVEPEPWRPKRHTPAGWWFAEKAYASYLKRAPAASPAVTPAEETA